jgi:sigma54-dependent transcription regulator
VPPPLAAGSRALEAGRRLFAVARQKKDNPNDADRLRKYLSRFGLSWQMIVDVLE